MTSDLKPEQMTTIELAAKLRAERRAAGLCPTCGKVKLTRREQARGYQCGDCTARDEEMGC